MPVAALVVVLASWVSAPATAQSNNTPAFTEGADTTRTIDENAVAGSDVGLPVTATDADAGDTLTYSLTGAAADAFSVDPITGQIWTLAALDFEAATRYRVTVTVRDDSGTANAAASIAVVIDVIDVAERPHAPAAPLVATTSRTALKVSWTEPDRNGGPAITGYTLRYRARARDSDTWGTWSGSVASDGTATSANLTGLTRNRLYEVQVRASNGELDSAWSASGAGATPAANAAVCGRSEKVREAIVDAIAGVDDCMDVTAAQLRAITGTLDLSDEGIGSLQAGRLQRHERHHHAQPERQRHRRTPRLRILGPDQPGDARPSLQQDYHGAQFRVRGARAGDPAAHVRRPHQSSAPHGPGAGSVQRAA